MQRKRTPAFDRVLAKIQVHPLGCWIFTGASNKGYGVIGRGGEGGGMTGAHRVTYEEAWGEIPDGLTVDHLCFNRRCVNPAHLELVTRGENTRRAWVAGRTEHVDYGAVNRAKTHCVAGHEYSEVNTYLSSRGSRQCRVCKRDAVRRHREKRNP